MSRRHLIGPFVDGDAEHALRIGLGRAWNAAMKPEERNRGAVVGQPDPVRVSATTPTRAKPCPCRGTSSTRVSLPTSSRCRVTVIPGNINCVV